MLNDVKCIDGRFYAFAVKKAEEFKQICQFYTCIDWVTCVQFGIIHISVFTVLTSPCKHPSRTYCVRINTCCPKFNLLIFNLLMCKTLTQLALLLTHHFSECEEECQASNKGFKKNWTYFSTEVGVLSPPYTLHQRETFEATPEKWCSIHCSCSCSPFEGPDFHRKGKNI